MENQIDFIYVDPKEHVTCLGLAIDDDWSDPQATLDLIASRLKWYVAYILDGQMSRERPGVQYARIVLWFTRPAPKKAFELCGILCNQIARQGVDAILTFSDELWSQIEAGATKVKS